MYKIKEKKTNTLVVLNQKSGNYKALSLFNNIKDVIENNYLIFISDNKEDTFNLLKIIDQKQIKYIIGVGGDGTINQILESTLSINPEIVLGHIPAGTGNGLSASILYKNNLEYSINNSVKAINRNKIDTIDIAKIQFQNSTKHCFLALSIGFISNLDINTEIIRCIGSYRYYLGSVIGLYQMKSYYLEIDYLDFDNQWSNIRDRFILFWSTNVSHPSYDVFISKDIKYNDGYHHIVLIKDSISRLDMLKILLGLDQGNILENPNVIYIKTKKYKVKVDEEDQGILTIDGEKAAYKSFKVNVESKINILG
jgi:diacylglycerol kinase family enzyme